jgi:uncharacterized protein YjiS (DUF1127 family)
VLRIASSFLIVHAAVSGARPARRSLLTPCWQQPLDRKGSGKLTGFRLRFERKIAMTMLTTIPTSATRPLAWRTAILLARLRRLINRFLAAVIARHERHAARVALHRLDDRQLQDLAMTRTQIESRLEELAQTRARMQQPGWH